jgi:GxxExxY protein
MTRMGTDAEEREPLRRHSASDQRDPQTFAILGAAMEVHRHLGGGFLEKVYHEALAVELDERGVPHSREHTIPVMYKGTALDCFYRADFVCYGEGIVELKAINALSAVDLAQVIDYLKATGLKRALLFNFHPPKLDYKRLVL